MEQKEMEEKEKEENPISWARCRWWSNPTALLSLLWTELFSFCSMVRSSKLAEEDPLKEDGLFCDACRLSTPGDPDVCISTYHHDRNIYVYFIIEREKEKKKKDDLTQTW